MSVDGGSRRVRRRRATRFDSHRSQRMWRSTWTAPRLRLSARHEPDAGAVADDPEVADGDADAVAVDGDMNVTDDDEAADDDGVAAADDDVERRR